MTTEEQVINTIYRRERLRRSLAKLRTPQQRLMVVLYLMGYTQDEIAAGFEISQQRVNQIVRDFKERNGLRWIMQDNW